MDCVIGNNQNIRFFETRRWSVPGSIFPIFSLLCYLCICMTAVKFFPRSCTFEIWITCCMRPLVAAARARILKRVKEGDRSVFFPPKNVRRVLTLSLGLTVRSDDVFMLVLRRNLGRNGTSRPSADRCFRYCLIGNFSC